MNFITHARFLETIHFFGLVTSKDNCYTWAFFPPSGDWSRIINYINRITVYRSLKYAFLFAHKYVLYPWLTGNIWPVGLCMGLTGERTFYGSMDFQFSSHITIKNNLWPKWNLYFQIEDVLKENNFSSAQGQNRWGVSEPQAKGKSVWGRYPPNTDLVPVKTVLGIQIWIKTRLLLT